MLKWAAIFLVIAIVAALLGFTGIAGAATDIARFLFFSVSCYLRDHVRAGNFDRQKGFLRVISNQWSVIGQSS